MNSMPQLPTAAMATRTTRQNTPATKTPPTSRAELPTGADRDDGLTETAFPHLLEARREVPEPAAEATEPGATTAEHATSALSAAAPSAAVAPESAPPTGQHATGPHDALIATLSLSRLQEPVTVEPTATGTLLPGKMPTGKTPTGKTPAVLLQGLALQKQPGFSPVVSGTDPTPSPTPDSEQPTAVRPALAPVTVQGNVIPTVIAPVSQAPNVTAATPVAASAVSLEAAAMSQEVYGQTPVVSEAQLLTALEKADDRLRIPLKAVAPVTQAPVDAAAPAANSAADAAPTDTQGDELADQAAPANIATATAVPPAVSEAQTESKAPDAGASDVDATDVDLGDLDESNVPSAASPGVGETVARTGNPGSTPLGASTARQVQQQVARQVTSRIADVSGQQKVTLRLNPESLGQVELNFEAKEDRLTVVISASNAEAENALRENLKDLTDRIVERSSRFSHVDIRVDVKDSGDARQDSKQDNKQEGRQEQRREQGRQDRSPDHDPHNPHAEHPQRAWENAMSWQLADAAASEEG
jgi:flagellar hook-length control protein FliK